ncbi:MAG TPA: MFS transporter [Burkholderiales bacterium]|nr:MFS transporter [Burkholderiales bacterium]
MTNSSWRNPAVVLACACLILMLSLGTRQSFGLFLQPLSSGRGWGREIFAFAIAVQNLVWGLAQPFSGMIADKYGAGRVLAVGAILYALGLVLMPLSTTGVQLDLSAGLLIGLGMSGTSFSVVLGVIGRSLSPEKRSMGLGIASAGGSFGQFAMLPFGQTLITHFGWAAALSVLAASVSFILLPALVLAGKKAVAKSAHDNQSVSEALHEAGGHQGFWYLTSGFLVCGFQTVFILLHLPVYLLDQGMTPVTGMIALALIGFFNIIGSYLAGYFGGLYSKKNLLAYIYLLRAAAIGLFMVLPITPATVYIFAAAMGSLWLGTVPLTNSLVAQIFGVKYLSTLFGIVFLGHQIGSFIGAWLGGYVFDLSGSYYAVWLTCIGLSLVAAVLCWPIDERQVARLNARETPA